MHNLLSVLLLLLFISCGTEKKPALEYSVHDVITLDFNVAKSEEKAVNNPFTNYRLEVDFTLAGQTVRVPGYYAADGNAGETSADSGSVWRVHFRPQLTGDWNYHARVYQGEDVVFAPTSVLEDKKPLLSETGVIHVTSAAPGTRGQLIRAHDRYLKWAGTDDYFLKAGADSPENILAYEGFDGTYRYEAANREGESTATKDFLHRFEPHLQDWKPGDLTWQDGKGKGLVGGLNYLASKGVNALYFLTMNINGDGKDVWPYTTHEERRRFDVSKLAQWEKVFTHADDELGFMLHFVTAETENETLLDNGDVGPDRRLYYRELVARFGHHRAVTWNLGEENGPNSWTKEFQTNTQQAACFAWFKVNDPHQHYVTVHTHPVAKNRREVLTPLLGDPNLDGLSIQIDHYENTNEETQYWQDKSAAAGKPWLITTDENGPWWRGLDHDDREPYNNQDSLRAFMLWGNLMAGGAGIEWYFGAKNPHNDLLCEDWRSRDRGWTWTNHAIRFFQDYLPFPEMSSHNELVTDGHFCFAKPGEVYAIYLPFGGEATLDLSNQTGDFTTRWYDPRNGGEPQPGEQVTGGKVVEFRARDTAGDWVILVEKD